MGYGMDYEKEINLQKHYNGLVFKMLTSQLEAISSLSLVIVGMHPYKEREIRGIVKKMDDDLKAIKDSIDTWGAN